MICPQGYRWQHETGLGFTLINAGSLCQGWGPLLKAARAPTSLTRGPLGTIKTATMQWVK